VSSIRALWVVIAHAVVPYHPVMIGLRLQSLLGPVHFVGRETKPSVQGVIEGGGIKRLRS